MTRKYSPKHEINTRIIIFKEGAPVRRRQEREDDLFTSEYFEYDHEESEEDEEEEEEEEEEKEHKEGT